MVLMDLEYTQSNYEKCVAIATLTDIYENGENETYVTVKIDKILQNNGMEEIFYVGNEVSADSNVQWNKQDDGTYEISFWHSVMPLAEIGYKYVVELREADEGYSICAMSLPMDSNYCYIDTVATGHEGYLSVSNEALWYYGVNETYYLDYWKENAENAEMLKINYDLDVYSRESVVKNYMPWK